MNVAETIITAIGTGGLTGALAWIAKGYTTKREHDSKDHAVDASSASTTLATMVRLLEREQDAHARTRDRLSATNTEVDLRGAQVGDLSARVELMIEEMQRTAAEIAGLRAEVADLRKVNDDCERRNATLAQRVYHLERKRTPPDGSEAISDSSERVRLGTIYREVPNGR